MYFFPNQPAMVSLSVTLAYIWFLTPLIKGRIGQELPHSRQHGTFDAIIIIYSVVEALQLKIDMHLKDYVTLNM